MKYLVISDIHGSSFYAKKIEEIYEKEKPEKIILLGDLYYHGPRNNLTEEYSPMEVAKILNKYKDIILCTIGNCDSKADQMISEFELKENIILDINETKFFFSHGDKYNITNIPPVGEVVIYGHFHQEFIKKENGIIFANPGSISLPRNNTYHSYMIIDDENIIIKDENGKIIEKEKYKK